LDGKRPYGNGFVPGDVVSILGWTKPDGSPYSNAEIGYDDALLQRVRRIHRELHLVLEVVCTATSMTPGLYRRHARADWQRGTWELVAAD
jgi:hypothetical protein